MRAAPPKGGAAWPRARSSIEPGMAKLYPRIAPAQTVIGRRDGPPATLAP